jgi:hypothetical protein
MRACAVKLVVEGAVLVQYAVEYIGRDPPCRETGHFGRYCESGRWHEAAMLGKVLAHAIGIKACLACEYAKCKNRHGQFRECDVICMLIPVLRGELR